MAGPAVPANLPLVDSLAGVHWGPPLLVLAVVSALLPRAGSAAFIGVPALALAGDQTRLQPEVVSLAVLMAAPVAGGLGAAIARWHLGTLWFWAGLHKALSLGWGTGAAATLAGYIDFPGGTIAAADRFSNMGPPTIPILALCCAQVGLVVANRERILRVAHRPFAQRVTRWLSVNAMPLFLWHTVGLASFYALYRVVTEVPESPSAVCGSPDRCGSSARRWSRCRCWPPAGCYRRDRRTPRRSAPAASHPAAARAARPGRSPTVRPWPLVTDQRMRPSGTGGLKSQASPTTPTSTAATNRAEGTGPV